jgi:thiamine-phosphate pyrophosphorylase
MRVPAVGERHEELMSRFCDAGLYLVTSESVSLGRSALQIIESGLAAGVKLIQLREKNLANQDLLDLAQQARRLTADGEALLIINDHIDIAMAVGADGVHLGQDDLAIAKARQMAPDMIIGASSHNKEEALICEQDGASYVNIGPLFPTDTKEVGYACVGVDEAQRIADCMSLPVTVMGGIKRDHIADLVSRGFTTIALVSAITAAPDPELAAKELLGDIEAAKAFAQEKI